MRLGLTGYARNMRDGSVEVETQGSHLAVQEFSNAVRRGPRRSVVDEVIIEERAPVLAETAFVI